jgi:hypothetical protein
MADRGFPKHFDGQRFCNPDAPQARSFLDGLRWKLTSHPEPSPTFIEDVMPSVPPRSLDACQIRVTMVNHSTVLVQCSGFNLLTDPIWSERASPLSWVGPKRRRKPGVRMEDLPPIDVVLISHNHFDHLDLPILRTFYFCRCRWVCSPASLPKNRIRSRAGLGRVIGHFRLHYTLRTGPALLGPWHS